MNRWLRRLRGALGMGLTWGVIGFLAGGVIELVHNLWPNPLGAAVDIWPAVLGYPAFVGGVAFSAVLGIAGRNRRFDELSLPVVAAWGALGGLVVALVPAAMVAVGLATPNVSIWTITLTIAGPLMIGGAAAAGGSLLLARRSEESELLEYGEDVKDAGLTEVERHELLGEENSSS